MFKHLEKKIRQFRYRVQRKSYGFGLPKLKNRRELPYLLNSKNLVGVGAEIGVKEGKFSELLLTAWKGDLLISIDSWLTADTNEYIDRANVSQERHNSYYEETKERLAYFKNRSKIIRKTSLEAARDIEDQSLDFCYIDARHDYLNVLEDLEAWYSKVKSGGVIAGHDYLDGMIEGTDFGVKKAVDEFFEQKGDRVAATKEKDYPSWYVIKK